MTIIRRDLQDPVPESIRDVARQVEKAGGRAWLVGGYVRDGWLGRPTKDLDVEVFGLGIDRLEKLLAHLGEVIAVGRAFGVLRVKGLDVDFSIPRRDSRMGKGHRGFRAEPDPGMTPAEAVRRRDLTVNALLLDPLTGEVLDPAGGIGDLEAGLLRAVDRRTFPEDPLRPVRVAQLVARLGFSVDPDLLVLSRGVDLSELPPERLWGEWHKLLLRAPRPSAGLAFLASAELLGVTPELGALIGVPQDPEWHPEGDVWEHTLRAVDAAAALRTGEEEHDLPLMLGALCHDLGKAPCTEFMEGRWRSHRHEGEGVEPAGSLLERLGAPKRLIAPVQVLVRHHLQPGRLVREGAGPRAYRRLARELSGCGVSLELLEAVARADALGRDEELAGFPEGDRFLESARSLEVERRSPPDVVLGRHLIARGMQPGPEMGALLRQCREVQDDTGWDDPERILDRALDPASAPRRAD